MITERIDAITSIGSDRLKSDPPAPRSVKIELTGRCNYRCSFCALSSRAAPAADMEWALFERLSAEMRDAGVAEIGLFYLGESFTTPDFLVRAVARCKDLGYPYVFLTTNGSLAAPAVVERAMMAGLDSLKWSVNACNEDQFESVMRVRTTLFRRSLDNLRSARELRDRGGYACRIYASSILYDGAQHDRMQALIDAHVLPYVDQHYWLPLYSMGSVATKREEELGFRPIAGNQGRVGALRDPLPCWSVFTEGHVTSDGKLSACCFDADGRFAMADLRETTFVEGWSSSEFRRLRDAHLARCVTGTPCERCIAYA